MKKIFLPVMAVCLIAAASFYFLGKRSQVSTESKHPQGMWHAPRQVYKKDAREEAYNKLIGLGYLDGHVLASGEDGVILYNRDKAYSGLNFFVSGHAPEANLIDMEGNVLHTWRYKNAYDIWEDVRATQKHCCFWRRAHLYDNGDILAIYEGIGMIKLDKDSNLVWQYSPSRKPHHDMDVFDDENIYVLTREWTNIPHISSVDISEDFITILNPDGELIKEYSIIDLIEKSPYARMLLNDTSVKTGGIWGHILHTNTIEVFDGSLAHISPLFKRGNVLISILITHTICIIDLAAEQVVWAMGSGMWRHQHESMLLPTGAMLIFDNKDQKDVSAIKEFDPFSQEILWEYRGTETSPFYSETCGAIQRLPNGNTLISETDHGRAFEVTPGGTIVWEYINPYRGGENGELIASLFEMVRIDPDKIDFLEPKSE